jgi:alkylation response protein AidB-like acyl-CoA dehydrogenase
VRASNLAERVARAWTAAEAYRLHTYRTATRILDGEPVGAETSIGKIHWSETDLAIQTAALDLLGEAAYVLPDPLEGDDSVDPVENGDPGSPDHPDGAWLDGFLFALAGPIYAGTNEIQHNLVAERLLGLPRG